jgi:hypothetical protein
MSVLIVSSFGICIAENGMDVKKVSSFSSKLMYPC